MKSITERTAFGARLVAARRYADMKQIPAAKAAGMSQGTLGDLEREGKGSSFTAVLAALYKVDPVWLSTGKGDMVPSSGVQPAPVKHNAINVHAFEERRSRDDGGQVILDLFNNMSERGKGAAINELRKIQKEFPKPNSANSSQ